MSQAQTEHEDVFRAPETAPAFLIHHEGDHVAVAVQNVAPGARVAVYMDSNRAITVAVTEPIPLGHKVALSDRPADAEIIEYGVRVGITRQAIAAGQLVHIHNMRSARWQNSR